MAVPPLGAKVIFEALIKTLENKPYDYIEANLMDRYKKPQAELFN